jgi:DNA-binding NarL/FixJ family response regulator
MKSIDKIQIVFIEDNRFIRDGWKITFESVPDFEVVGSFPTCEEALQSNIISKADVVLLDIRLPGISGIEGANNLSKKYPQLLIVMCTLYEDDENIFNAILAGAVGFISKRATPSELVKSIKNLIDGGSPMTPNVARKVLSFIKSKDQESINKNEILDDSVINILNKIAIGKSYHAIAGELSVNVEEILFKVRSVYQKLHQKYSGSNYQTPR